MKNTQPLRQQNPPSTTMRTVAVIGSATYATKARDVLLSAAIRAETVKITTPRSGCAYGVAFQATQKPNVAFVLDRAGIPVREYTETKT